MGCGSGGLRAIDPSLEVVGLDARPQPTYPGPPESFVMGDARAMPFADAEFDVAYCNSLIEHLAPADRPRLAAELRRVAKRWFVQTPNHRFPVEPHVLLPLVQFLPRGLRLSGQEGIELLRRRELEALFPDAEIVAERAGPLVKSWIAIGPRP